MSKQEMWMILGMAGLAVFLSGILGVAIGVFFL
jgi:hypothetical protein